MSGGRWTVTQEPLPFVWRGITQEPETAIVRRHLAAQGRVFVHASLLVGRLSTYIVVLCAATRRSSSLTML